MATPWLQIKTVATVDVTPSGEVLLFKSGGLQKKGMRQTITRQHPFLGAEQGRVQGGTPPARLELDSANVWRLRTCTAS